MTAEKYNHCITLAYDTDTAYILSITNNDEEDIQPKDAQELTIVGDHEMVHSCTELDKTSAEEFLYGWAGSAFASHLLQKNVPMALHTFEMTTENYRISMFVGGAAQNLSERAFAYASTLKIRSR